MNELPKEKPMDISEQKEQEQEQANSDVPDDDDDSESHTEVIDEENQTNRRLSEKSLEGVMDDVPEMSEDENVLFGKADTQADVHPPPKKNEQEQETHAPTNTETDLVAHTTTNANTNVKVDKINKEANVLQNELAEIEAETRKQELEKQRLLKRQSLLNIQRDVRRLSRKRDKTTPPSTPLKKSKKKKKRDKKIKKKSQKKKHRKAGTNDNEMHEQQPTLNTYRNPNIQLDNAIHHLRRQFRVE